MRQLTLALLLSLGALPVSAYENERFGFAVDFPAGKVVEGQIGVKSPYVGRLYHVVDGKVERFGVSVVEYPRVVETGSAARRAYIDDVRDKLIARSKGTVVLERAVVVGEHAGREITVRTTALEGFVGFAVRYTQRVFLVDKRYFSVFTVSRDPGDAQRAFLDSFRLIKDPGAPEIARFDVSFESHDDGMKYSARLPAEHLRVGPQAATRAIELLEEVHGLALSRVYRMRSSPLVFYVSTMRLSNVDASNAEAIVDAVRKDVAAELDLQIQSAEVAIAAKGKAPRILRLRGTRDDAAERLSLHVDVHLTADGLYQVAVFGPASEMKSEDARGWLTRFTPAPSRE